MLPKIKLIQFMNAQCLHCLADDFTEYVHKDTVKISYFKYSLHE